MQNEIGGNYLNTAFTGTINPALSGHPEFPMMLEDMGTAAPLGQKEFKNPGCIPPVT